MPPADPISPTPQVSVIIPAYNGERFITAALESVLQQTYQDYEIIVVNDGSQDNTAAALRPFLSQIRYFEQENQGVAAARNRGLSLAKGEFVAFLDQDDVLLPDKLALQVACFNQHPQIGIVHSGWRLVNAAGQTLSDIEPWHDIPVLDAASWIQRMPVLFSAMLFRRNWLMRVGGIPTQFQQACDLELVQKLVLAGCESVWLPQVTVLYRQHDRNDSLNTLIQAREVWAAQEYFFTQNNLPAKIRQIEKESRYYTAIWIAWRLYYTGHFEEMAHYLEKAFEYRPKTWTEAILQWIELFKKYEIEHGRVLDIEALTQSTEWQKLVRKFTVGI